MFVRVRPPDPHLESEVEQGHCLEVASSTSLTVHCKPEPKIFTFDHVAGMSTTQVRVLSGCLGPSPFFSCFPGTRLVMKEQLKHLVGTQEFLLPWVCTCGTCVHVHVHVHFV